MRRGRGGVDAGGCAGSVFAGSVFAGGLSRDVLGGCGGRLKHIAFQASEVVVSVVMGRSAARGVGVWIGRTAVGTKVGCVM
ncbi:MAG: hypothetical protein HIU91_14540 [Acidobacteria bacterium]|nr:hypothetical protein [Acidobacteriota bacterium]